MNATLAPSFSGSLKAPFPWFGGKRRCAHLVWPRFGEVVNYVEPFAGSLAVLLSRPHEPRNETVNDLDCYLSNFWRAIAASPELTAKWADWPVNEADLHARHLWLVNQDEFRHRMRTDPDYFDPKIAGWWVWGISQWIGSGWCVRPEWTGRGSACRAPRGLHGERWKKRPMLGRGGHGVLRVAHKIPDISGRHGSANGRGVLGVQFVPKQHPDISGDSGASGRGINAKYCAGIHEYFDALHSRLRRVRVCCGDWSRILSPSATTKIGVTAVLLDPPYAADRDTVYSQDSLTISSAVRRWAIENGDNSQLRIALCGYEGEHEMPASWRCLAWKANGGYGNQSGSTRGRANARRERIWFSPHCHRALGDEFGSTSAQLRT